MCECAVSDPSPSHPYPDSRVSDLHPLSHGMNLIVKVVEIKVLLERRRPDGSVIAVAEALVGDASGCVLLTARNGTRPSWLRFDQACSFVSFPVFLSDMCSGFRDSAEQIGLLQPGASLSLLNAKINMFQNRMRLVVDLWGMIEPTALSIEGAVDVQCNISEEDYLLVPSLHLVTDAAGVASDADGVVAAER
jgi:replication factor A1